MKKPCADAPVTPWWKPNDPSYQCPIDQNNPLIVYSKQITEFMGGDCSRDDQCVTMKKIGKALTFKTEVTVPFYGYNPMHLSAPVYGIGIAIAIVAALVASVFVVNKSAEN